MDVKKTLATEYPNIANEWHPSKNGAITPDMVAPKSGKKVWWICDKGHEWQAEIASRVDGRGCPVCAKETQTSFPEQAVFYYIKQCFPDAINADKDTLGVELDIYIPSKKCAIEYDGLNWHKNNPFELEKNKLCKNQDIFLIRIREEGLNKYDDCCCVTRRDCKVNSSLNSIIEQVIQIIDSTVNADINVDRDTSGILELYKTIKRESSLEAVYPQIAAEWHPSKNGRLKPEAFSYGSKARVWWLCSQGHEWQASIVDRTKGNQCPYCSNRKVLKGFNDLQTTNPILSKEWHPTKNGRLLPDMITSGSKTSVWWLGACGHEWKASILNRQKGSGCPYCSNHEVLSGFNDLATRYPAIANEWHPTRNSLLPSMVTAKSNKKVWWLGKCGHEWEAKIEDRTNGNGCPVCAGKTVLFGFNDLATKNPELATEWNYAKNKDLKPSQVTYRSSKKVWWQCKKGHEWIASIDSRADGKGCPYCASARVLKGFNDLKTVNPELAKEWHPFLNGEITPESVMPNSNKKVWWLGKCNHEWSASISSRAFGSGCPICAGKVILSGFNDLLSKNPDLAAEWHPTKNGLIKPIMVPCSSHKKVWWHGKCGHEWEDTIAHRSEGRGCPFCSNHKVLAGFNDLKTKNPKMAAEWHPTKNGGLLPTMVSAYSHARVWWICKEGHEWETSIKNRSTRNSGCPICSRKKKKQE